MQFKQSSGLNNVNDQTTLAVVFVSFISNF